MDTNAKRRAMAKIALAALILLVGLAAITSRSLWSDEISHAEMIAKGNFPAQVEHGLVFGKVGYLMIEYLWGRVLTGNVSEFALRCSNLVFSAFAIFYAFRIVERRGWTLWMSLLFFLHPIYIYYMNEVTPYILLYALAMGFTYHVFFTGERFSSVRNIVAINAIYLFGVFVHFIFGFIIILYFAHCLRTIRRDRALVRRHAGIMLAFGVGYLPMLYLVLTRMQSTVRGFSVLNVLYVIYAFLGMAGLGLSRMDLRARNIGAFVPDQILLLAAFVLVAAVTFVLLLRRRRALAARNRALLIPLGAYFAVLIPVALVADFAMWERHCIVVLPVCILLMGDALTELRALKLGRVCAVLLAALVLLSSARLRFDSRYARDDFKGLTADIAAELQTNEDLTVIFLRMNGYYDLRDAVTSPDQEILNADRMDGKEIYDAFMSRVERCEDVMLVLFVSNTPDIAYQYFDSDPGFTVDDSYIGFKVIRPVYT